jgi:hypothetical protein
MDTGDQLAVTMKRNGVLPETHHLPVVHRTPGTIEAQAGGDSPLFSIVLHVVHDLKGGAATMGELISRTYEVDQTWHFRCDENNRLPLDNK